jgi:hypothetical protein
MSSEDCPQANYSCTPYLLPRAQLPFGHPSLVLISSAVPPSHQRRIPPFTMDPAGANIPPP